MNTLSPALQSMLDNRLRYLPEITGKAIASIDWSSKIIEIGHKYGIHVDDIEDLQAVVLKSMIGLLPPDEFEKNLILATAVSPSVSEQIIIAMNQAIFEPIHQFVMADGKPKDPLAAAGIELQKKEPEPYRPNPQGLATPPIKEEISQLEIPASPEPKVVTRKPIVQGKFDDFFVNVSTQTDHSMVR